MWRVAAPGRVWQLHLAHVGCRSPLAPQLCRLHVSARRSSGIHGLHVAKLPLSPGELSHWVLCWQCDATTWVLAHPGRTFPSYTIFLPLGTLQKSASPLRRASRCAPCTANTRQQTRCRPTWTPATGTLATRQTHRRPRCTTTTSLTPPRLPLAAMGRRLRMSWSRLPSAAATTRRAETA